MDPLRKHDKIKLVEINSYLTCYLCKGYLIDATTISECLHSFCRSCIIKFLQENCYCPVCEVIINKAKPCLKLDKTLQDIVYKLVPELFVNEMQRRKVFYQNRPTLTPKLSPEQRGEDTERTIFNPQDAISLSLEYVSDDSPPGAISSLQKNGSAEEVHDNPMKRYLQCPGMCRIEVLKKFVRNKYNVDTNLFHIDVLYKRVPLPDHYTLIDIGYIYSWKRNEPMKFFFRITDINKVTERFDYFDGRPAPDVVQKPSRVKEKGTKDRKQKREQGDARTKPPLKVESVKSEVGVKLETDDVKSVKDEKLVLKPEITEQIKNKIQCEGEVIKNAVYTNITLNREENVEIITKIQKVSNKEGHPIGLNIINHTVKKTTVQNNNNNNSGSNSKIELVSNSISAEKTEQEKKEEEEKSKFLKSIELTARTSPTNDKNKTKDKEVKDVKSAAPAASSSQKRKNSSPMKNDKEKKQKVKIVIQPNPTVHQMVANVNQNVNKMSKIVEEATPKSTDLQSLIDNCKINIPSSLSITLNEGGDAGARTAPSIPPVKNFIEILKLPDNDKKSPEARKGKSSPGKNRNIPTFQKIFEESIKKTPNATRFLPLDLTSDSVLVSAPMAPKRKILEIASQLKKTKIEQEKRKEVGKVAIPRLVTQRTLRPVKYELQNRPQTSASLHSSSLGLNYTVSVGQEAKRTAPSTSKAATPNSKAKQQGNKTLSPNQLLEKYNIQNLAQLTAGFNFNGGVAALQHAMLLKQLEHQSWLNQEPLLQYEKYLQNLSAQNKIMGNIKEN